MAITPHNLCLLATFCLPLYFSTQAILIFPVIDGLPNRDGSNSRVPQHGRIDILPLHNTRSRRPSPSSNFLERMAARFFGPSAAAGTPTHDNDVEVLWAAYVERCWKEWAILLPLTCTILLSSPPLFQMTGANTDHVVRCLLYVFIFRLMAVVPSSLALLFYFSKSEFRSGAFAKTWKRCADQNRLSSLHMPWIMLALPAISFCWGLVVVVIAVFLSAWRNGHSVIPPPTQTSGSAVTASTVTGTIVTIIVLIDVVWITWLVIRLRKFKTK
ncbi:hypothetical protein H0H87_005703 [Tephrocybe sp. NHM501043]|nr:hypothetical protein H0H87_005703 [Tephrocybe sp. NHM501043]